MYFSKLLLLDIIEFASNQGADRTELYNEIGIELTETIDPRSQISYDQMVRALNITGQTINDEFLGLHLGEQMMLKSTRQVDKIMQNSPNIEEAFSNALTYGKLISDALTSTLSKTEHYTKVSFSINPNWAIYQSQVVQQIIDMTLVCTLKSIHRLTGKSHTPVMVHLNTPNLKKKNEYYRAFDCSIKFNEPIPSIIFQSQLINQRPLSPDLGLLTYLKKIADEEIKTIPTESPLIISIKRIVLNKLPKRSSIDDAANKLHLSSRTLQRRLQELNTNFKAVEKDIIIKLAKKIILYEKRSLDEISYLLGFSEASALIRFFKKELNTTPKKYKELHLNK